jgi:serine/threonine protein kinase
MCKFSIYIHVECNKNMIIVIARTHCRGYMSPEYATQGQLSEKVDVYSFGVLVLEIVTGRKNIDSSLPPDEIYILAWVRDLPM